MLLNEFLKEHRKVEEQQAAIAQLKATAAQQQKQIEALIATAMLLNEFLKEHRNVAEQQSTITELKTTVAQQQKQIETLRAGLQKINASVELHPKSKAPTAANN